MSLVLSQSNHALTSPIINRGLRDTNMNASINVYFFEASSNTTTSTAEPLTGNFNANIYIIIILVVVFIVVIVAVVAALCVVAFIVAKRRKVQPVSTAFKLNEVCLTHTPQPI
ncbi:hypothetical protein AKO1_007804 [Acrasis kona]|uniref:Uncharacterized protein n=1 Tax=Acrasis kona TaxID=1008807 RepID=A0AAW2ZBN6_9EUKA